MSGAGSHSTPRKVLIALTNDWVAANHDDEDGRPETLGGTEDIDTFAAAIREHGGVPVDVVVTRDVPADLAGTLLVGEDLAIEELARQRGVPAAVLLPRTVLLNARRRLDIMQLAEATGLAAAIEYRRYWIWRTERDDDPGGGVFGRKDVALHMGATWDSPGLWETAHYCTILAQDDHPTLPDALAAYVIAYAVVHPDAVR